MARAPKVSKELHPADARRADVLASPAGFTASIRFGNRNNTIGAPTLLEAALQATRLERAVAELGGSTLAIVYALPRDGGGPETVDSATWRALATGHLQAYAARRVGASRRNKES